MCVEFDDLTLGGDLVDRISSDGGGEYCNGEGGIEATVQTWRFDFSTSKDDTRDVRLNLRDCAGLCTSFDDLPFPTDTTHELSLLTGVRNSDSLDLQAMDGDVTEFDTFGIGFESEDGRSFRLLFTTVNDQPVNEDGDPIECTGNHVIVHRDGKAGSPENVWQISATYPNDVACLVEGTAPAKHRRLRTAILHGRFHMPFGMELWDAALSSPPLPCSAHEDCDDDFFCNGVETCDVNGECQPGQSACSAEGLVCDEEIDMCVDTTCGGNKAACTSDRDCCSGRCTIEGICRGN